LCENFLRKRRLPGEPASMPVIWKSRQRKQISRIPLEGTMGSVCVLLRIQTPDEPENQRSTLSVKLELTT